MSTKTLADVVEALIGVCYIDGGIPKALSCISLFLSPDKEWESVEAARKVLFDIALPDAALPANMEPLESLTGYTFTRKALLVEAMTHASYNGIDVTCLERLEFLGDAVLDHIVVRKLFGEAHPPLAHSEMHLLRTALVNGDFIGFISMEWDVEQTRHDIAPADKGWDGSGDGDGDGDSNNSDNKKRKYKHSFNDNQPPPKVEASTARLPLWGFMRFSSTELAAIQAATTKRHAQLRERILAALREGDRYPWALLARLQAQKVYSDVFESLLGAVWVDSGSYDACEALLERSGVLPYMHRLLRDRVRILHPREELGQLAGGKPVDYQMNTEEIREGEREVSCRLTVDKNFVARVDGCLNREEAGTRVAEEAIRRYRELGGRWPGEEKK